MHHFQGLTSHSFILWQKTVNNIDLMAEFHGLIDRQY